MLKESCQHLEKKKFISSLTKNFFSFQSFLNFLDNQTNLNLFTPLFLLIQQLHISTLDFLFSNFQLLTVYNLYNPQFQFIYLFFIFFDFQGPFWLGGQKNGRIKNGERMKKMGGQKRFLFPSFVFSWKGGKVKGWKFFLFD